MFVQTFRAPISQRLVIFDRDDTLISDKKALQTKENISWLPGRTDTLREVSDNGYDIAIATNQGAIAKNQTTVEVVQDVHIAIASELLAMNINLIAIAFCPHHPKGEKSSPFTKLCHCRKPQPGLLSGITSIQTGGYKKVFMFGNSEVDVEAARKFQGGFIEGYQVLLTDDFSSEIKKHMSFK